jgi:hypothetical protein
LGRNLAEKSIWVKNHVMKRVNVSTDSSEVLDSSKGAIGFFNWEDESVVRGVNRD